VLCNIHKIYKINKTRNTWQSLACSLRGIAMTPPSEYLKRIWVLIAPQNSVLCSQGLAVAPSSQTAGRRGVYVFALLKLRSYWTISSLNFLQCSQIIADEPFEIGIAIFHSVSECQGDDWRCVGRFRPFLTLKLVAMATSLEQSEMPADSSFILYGSISDIKYSRSWVKVYSHKRRMLIFQLWMQSIDWKKKVKFI